MGKDVGNIEQQLNVLRKNIDSVKENLTTLTERLNLVLRNGPESATLKEDAKEQSKSRLANELEGLSSDVEDLNNEVLGLISNCDL